jgi:hypothetical protein
MSAYKPPHLRNPIVEQPPRMPQRSYNNSFKTRQKSQWDIQREEAAKQKEQDEKAREEKRLRGLEMNDENFPTLGNATTSTSGWAGRKFSELVSEWKEEDDRTKEEDEILNSNEHDVFVLPKFTNLHRFEEPEDIVEEVSSSKQVDDEWTTVKSKKNRKPKPLPSEEQDNFEEQENNDTVWSEERQEHETCWDERP